MSEKYTPKVGDKELQESLAASLEQSGRGELVYLGSFAQYAEGEDAE